MHYRRHALYALISTTILAWSQAISAQQETAIEEVVIWGRSLQQLGTADSASQGVVGYNDFSTRPIARVAELVEVVPGMIATQHSGPGKANQYFLRGFNLDHGSDFSTFFDGMPVNWRSHGHAQGYMDLNFIIPEIVERVDFQKGPYFADTGDFSLAGSSSMKTYDALEENFTEITFGSEDEIRLVTANSIALGDGTLLYALEHQQTDGHFDLEQDVRKYNGLLKYTGDIANIPSRITFSAYDSKWISTNQVPERAVSSGLIDRFGFIDPDLGGNSHRYSLSGNFELENWDLNLYASSYYMSLINNPTYELNDPVNGDEFEQEDQRRLFGGSLRNETDTEIFGIPVTRAIGSDVRYDDVNELNLFTTVGRRRIGSLREDQAEELSIGLFGELQFAVTQRLRATVGVRMDYYDFEVDALRTANSGSDSDSLWQPKIGLAYRFNENLEFYANYGHGFHSNDVRAAVNTIDPATGDVTDSLDVLVEGKGSEVGFRYDNLQGFNISMAAFELRTDSELVFVGDAGTTEPSDPTRRDGVELNSFWEISPRLVFDLSAAYSDGHFRGLPSGMNSIPDAHDRVIGAGLTYVGLDNGWTSSLRMRHFSDAALSEDESIKKDGSTLLHFGVSYAQQSWELGLDVLNLLDKRDDDIAYWFESRLAGELAGVEDIHFHPSNPRTIRLLMRYKF
ncbi:MAG: TonB-dependent receptor [Gammaproteobacteria bacterium]|nr:TonB-dependent receptor [Gammaproteobacteria bacterium]HJN95762.1 TonB-dependent receptor [Gammaproteobacteria bacterium]|tara:strand:+ start:25052 stop:27097 length:2046 start_codon:yes stop_codon:yes gene_type:complete